jgi:hypothetical protein
MHKLYLLYLAPAPPPLPLSMFHLCPLNVASMFRRSMYALLLAAPGPGPGPETISGAQIEYECNMAGP